MSGLIATSLFLFLTPILLFCAGLALRFSIRDQFLNDNAIWLYGWGFAAVAIAILGMISRSTLLLGFRRFVAATALLATILFSGAYVYLGLAAYGGAQKTEPERTFELVRSCGRKCAQLVHQRADGSTVEGLWAGPAVPYGNCALVQRLDGEHAFRWVRVLERSRGDGSNLAWPIRREDCFGNKPVSSLHG